MQVDWVVASGVGCLGFFIGTLTGLFVAARPNGKDLLLNGAVIVAVVSALIIAVCRFAPPDGTMGRDIWFLPVGLALGLLCGLFLVMGKAQAPRRDK